MVATQQAIDGYTDSQLKVLQSGYQAAIKNTAEKLASDRRFRSRKALGRKREKALLAELRIAEKAISEQLSGAIAADFAEVGLYSKDQIEAIVSWDGKTPGFNNILLTAQELEAYSLSLEQDGYVLEDRLAADIGSLSEGVKSELVAGRIAGESARTVAKRIFDAGAGEKTLRQIEGTYLTYIQSANSYAREQVYAANSDIVREVEWSAVLETMSASTGHGTCIKCFGLDGNRYRLDEERPDNPLHNRCRCLYMPVTTTWQELGLDIPEMENEYRRWTERDLATRKILDYGTTDQTKEEWWFDKSKAWQDNSFGPTRAQMVRAKIIRIDDLSDRQTGEQRTVKELERIARNRT